MRVVSLAVIAAFVLAAPGVQAGEGYCKAMVKGSAGESVEVDFTVKDGAITSRGAKWDAPHADDKDAPQGPTLEIGYWPITAEALAVPTSVTFSVFSASGVAATAGATASVALDGGKTWSVATFSMLFVTMGQIAVRTDGDPVNPDLLDTIEHAQSASATLTSPAGTVIVSTAFALANHGTRDQLFKKAWDVAAQIAAAPEPCKNAPIVSTLN